MVGKSYPACWRLIQAAAVHWGIIDGERTERGLPTILTLRADRFFNFMWLWAMKHTPEDERENFAMMLNAPLPVQKDGGAIAARAAAPTPEEIESEMADFGAFYAQVTAGG